MFRSAHVKKIEYTCVRLRSMNPLGKTFELKSLKQHLDTNSKDSKESSLNELNESISSPPKSISKTLSKRANGPVHLATFSYLEFEFYFFFKP